MACACSSRIFRIVLYASRFPDYTGEANQGAQKTAALQSVKSRRAASWRSRTAIGWLQRIILVLFVLLVPAPALLILAFRALPVPGTPQMLASWLRGNGAHYRWVSMDHIAPVLAYAVIASEDQ